MLITLLPLPSSPPIDYIGPVPQHIRALFSVLGLVIGSPHPHSIVNEPFLRFIINDLLIGVGGNTMKNTMLRNFLK